MKGLRFIEGIRPLVIDGDRLIAERRGAIGELSNEGSFDQVSEGWHEGWRKMACRFPFISRLLRLSSAGVVSNGNVWCLVSGSGITTFNNNWQKVGTFKSYRGTRPLRIIFNPHSRRFYFGEYFSNNDRTEVNIYSSSDGLKWDVVYTFSPGQIRHVHGIQYDSYQNSMIVLTGDSNAESAIWITKNEFKTLEKWKGGSQKYRAVSVIIKESEIIVPMDSPLEKNFISCFSRDGLSEKVIFSVAGSAFHVWNDNRLNLSLVSTVTEPSKVNLVDSACIYASVDDSWKEIFRIRKDWIPIRFQRYFRYAEIQFIPGIWNDKYIVALGRSLKGLSEGMVLIDVNSILSEF